VEKDLPNERDLGALLVRANPLTDEPSDAALEDTVAVISRCTAAQEICTHRGCPWPSHEPTPWRNALKSTPWPGWVWL
jgi:Rieske Fe-S protein